MLISSIELQNFGVFKGNHKLNLAPKNKWKKNRPVVLIGGKNGSGKSTIFDAIKLCLYGFKAIGEKVSISEYESYLSSRINWFALNNEITFIKMVFKVFRESSDAKKSREYEYEITREWFSSGKKIKEVFSVYEDGILLELNSEFWQDFVEEIIPQGVIDLFFFDGEKIQSLAEGSNENLEHSIKSLLNLSIIPSLSSDLKLIYSRYLDKTKDSKNSKELKTLKKEVIAIEKNLESDRSHLASSESKSILTRNRIKSLEEKLKKEGGEYYSQRDSLKKIQVENSLKLDQKKQKIGQMCEDYIPFMLSPNLIKRMVENLESDGRIQEEKLLGDILSKKRITLDRIVKNTARELKLDKKVSKSLCDRVSGYTASWVEEYSSENSKYDLPPNIIYQILETLSKTKKKRRELIDLFEDIEKLSRQDKKIEEKIERALESNAVIKIHKEIQKQSQILGSQEKTSVIYEDKISKKERELHLFKKRIEALEKSLIKNKKEKKSYDRIKTIREVLSVFEKELTETKVKQLEDAIYNCYSKIHRKSGFIGGIRINPKNFEVTMFDRGQRIVPIERLSAGEKQIYAISVLWALARMSGKTLPMVIDTPLGRLDKDHRTQLVENFFSEASHQVIILSTDTEIDERYFQGMKKYISHTYNIDFNIQRGYSDINTGYLFPQETIIGSVQ